MQQRAGLRLKEAGKGLYLREANKLMSNIEKNIEKKTDFAADRQRAGLRIKDVGKDLYLREAKQGAKSKNS